MVIMMTVRQSVASNGPQTQHSNSSQAMRNIQFPSHASITSYGPWQLWNIPVTSQTGPDPQCPDCASPWVMLLPPSHGAVWQKPAALQGSHLAHPSPCKWGWSRNYVYVNLTFNPNGILCLRNVIINSNTVTMPILQTEIFNISSVQTLNTKKKTTDHMNSIISALWGG
jgi:hypothetical protein